MRDPEPLTSAELSYRTPPPRTGRSARKQPRVPRFRPDADRQLGASTSRLAAILAADVVGYTRHMAEDEAGTHACFTAIFRTVIEPRISRYGARIVKNTGDGFLAEFWSASRAVRCAISIQNAIQAWHVRQRGGRQLKFRVGINVGDVIVEPHDIFGHTVNIAARLEAMADPGSVMVSSAVFASVRDRSLLFDDLGEFQLKNMTEPVRGFRVTADAAHSGHRQ
jgi:class 3 adenylate cyclase